MCVFVIFNKISETEDYEDVSGTAVVSGAREKMSGVVEGFTAELRKLSVGRANPSLLSSVVLSAYGNDRTPLDQVATVNAPEARILTIQVWDNSLAPAVEKAILSSGLGLSPQRDGSLLRIQIPEATKERRQEMVKVVRRTHEDYLNSIRSVRRVALDKIKKIEKDKLMSEDEKKRFSKTIQDITDSATSKMAEILEAKCDEIMSI